MPRNGTGMGRRPTAVKNHFSLEISLSRTQETSLRPKNLPPRSHNFHPSAKKSCKKSSAGEGASLQQQRHSAGPNRPRAVSAASIGPLQLRKALGLGVHSRPVATRAQRPHPHPSQLPPAVGGETKGKEGQCWARQAIPRAPLVSSTPSARGCQLPPQVGSSVRPSRPGRRNSGRRPPSASPPPPSSLPRGSGSPRGGGAR